MERDFSNVFEKKSLMLSKAMFTLGIFFEAASVCFTL